MGPLSREAELILHSARRSLDEAHREAIRSLIRSGLDWDLLHTIATRHRLGVLMYKHINDVAAEDVPRPVFMDLWRTFERNARDNAERASELERVCGLIEDSGVDVLAYKGPVSSLQLLGDVALREFEDLDILVRFSAMPPVKTLLHAHGYDVAEHLDADAERAFYKSPLNYHRVFVHRGHGTKLEVHWRTDPRYPVEDADNAAWWERLPRVTLRSRPIRTFGATEQLLIFCLHGTKHQGHRLGWLLELAVLIDQGGIDWPSVERYYTALRCRRRVLVSLLLAERWTEARLPSSIRAAIDRDRGVRDAADVIAARLFTTDIEERQSLDRLKLDLKLCDSTRQRWDYAVNVAFRPSVEERAQYALPAPLHFLYLPLRVARLAGKYARPGARRQAELAKRPNSARRAG